MNKMDNHASQTNWDHAQGEFRKYYRDNQLNLENAKVAFTSMIEGLLSQLDIPRPKVLGRVKVLEECVAKYERKYLPDLDIEQVSINIAEKLTDLIGIRIICIHESNIEIVADHIRECLEVIEETDKTSALEKSENQFGYKGLHLDVQLDEQRRKLPENAKIKDYRFEIQIRSIVQDAWSEVDHKIKYKKQVPVELKRRINRLAALFELADQEFESIRKMTADFKEEAGKSDNIGEVLGNALSSLNFSVATKDKFCDFEPHPHAVDNFVDELVAFDGDITVQILKTAIDNHYEKAGAFNDYLIKNGSGMNPFTIIRHCLYLEDGERFGDLLQPFQKNNFDDWASKSSQAQPIS